MNCPHCGVEMKDEQVFCEVCGKERQIVPDFEVEIDESIESTRSTIASDLADTVEIKDDEIKEIQEQKKIDIEKQMNDLSDTSILPDGKDVTKKESASNRGKQLVSSKRKFHIFLIVLGILGVILLVALVGGIIYLSNVNSYEYQLEKAEEMQEKQLYSEMLAYAQKASELAPNSSDARMLLANSYEGLGDEKSQEYILEELLSMDPAYSSAYDKLIPIYEKQKKYTAIGKLLLTCEVQSVLDKYVSYQCSPPSFSDPAGEYADAISLKMIAPGKGDVYYTMDGSEPGEDSIIYSTPIILVEGEYEIKAIYYNEYGIGSDVVSAKYTILPKEVGPIAVSLDSGSYTTPQMIEVELPTDGCHVFYTTDGSEPNFESREYVKPIPLPIGESRFAFIMYDEEEMPSEIASYQYRLSVNEALSQEQARFMLIQTLNSIDYIKAVDGSLYDMEGFKNFEIVSVIAVDESDYYLVEESYVSPEGNVQKTGVLFAVNATDGQCFKAYFDEQGMASIGKLQ